ncbi:MAG TPA: DMT family transporter [candidate division Zixibacteria bacterium]|nr:DMT family transporter [candidate division Zixibacteria bacterium]
MAINADILGELLSLLCAVAWAVAVVLFRKSGETVHPIGLNLYKSLLATLFLVPSILIFERDMLGNIAAVDYVICFISGVVGIAVSDTLFFKSLNRLGAGLSSIVMCLYSPFIIILSMFWLSESISFRQWLGTLLIVSAVASAVSKPTDSDLDTRSVMIGLLWGVGYLFTNAIGVVLVKPVLDRSPVMWVTQMRIVGGIICLLPMLYWHPHRREIVRTMFAKVGRVYTITGSFIGSYVAMILWMGGMKYTTASVAAILNQMSTIFIFILATVFLKEKMTTSRVVGVILGVAGTIFVMFG